ncbi:MAG TPA: hypothetical protein ENI05_01730 [Porticoccus sp.]|nr:hypothetical protein [Porticoccus sp.]
MDWLVNEQMLTNAEDSFFEIFSAVAWFFAAILFFFLNRVSVKKNLSGLHKLWFLLFFILSVFAFGEEISWGDHLFDYSHDLGIVQINAQQETNIHNVNLSKILDLSEESAFYPYLDNFGYILTPLFYLVLAFIWVFLPLIKLKTSLGNHALFKDMPVPSIGFMVFFIIHGVFFVFIDVALFNVGPVFEMFIGLAAVIVALDMIKNANYKDGVLTQEA